MNVRLTWLQRMTVAQEDGRELGRVMDVRARAPIGRISRDDALDAQALLVGASGWLEEMGLRQGGAREVSAASIRGVEAGKVIVRATAATHDARHGRRRS